MSRSVSAPSSVTKTSPCWNGLIVPGSTFRYGSNFWSWMRSPRALRSRPSDAATMPFPSADTTPPVTKTYFGARALTGFQGSRGGGLTLLAGAEERVQPRERLHGIAAVEADQPRPLDEKPRPRPACVRRLERQLDADAVAGELEREPLPRDDVEDEQRSGRLRLAEVARLVRPDHRPARTGRQPAAVRLDARDARPPVREVVGLGQERPHVSDRGDE